jgi:hypothetical protein
MATEAMAAAAAAAPIQDTAEADPLQEYKQRIREATENANDFRNEYNFDAHG